MSSNQEIPLILCCAVVHGIIRKSSWSWPVALSPLGLRTPSTRNGWSRSRMDFPIGSSSPKSCSATLRPSTQTFADVATSCCGVMGSVSFCGAGAVAQPASASRIAAIATMRLMEPSSNDRVAFSVFDRPDERLGS